MTSLSEEHIRGRLEQLFAGERSDDCAYEPLDESSYRLTSTDLLVEGVHFLRERIDPHLLGQKCLNVNLSDIAAMGGRPTNFYLSLAVPRDLDGEYLEAFFQGLKTVADEHQLELRGGDTCASTEQFVINILIEGEVSLQNLRTRKCAERGDVLCVTGRLGDSRVGLELLSLNKEFYTSIESELIKRHSQAQAFVKQGQWLAGQKSVKAMLDVSDGLAVDLHRLMKSSECGVRIELAKLPLSNELCVVAKEQSLAGHELAYSGGEDYVLLLSVSVEQFETLALDYEAEFNQQLVQIGDVVEPERGLELYHKGSKFERFLPSFEHFN